MKGGAVFIFLFLILLYSVSAFDGKSFCRQYDSEDEISEKYDGYCELYVGDVIVFSGLSVSIEYINDDQVSFNVNGERSILLSEGENYYFENVVDDDVLFSIDSIFHSDNENYVSGVSFNYNNEKIVPRSFCMGVICTLYEDDEILIDIHDVRLSDLCVDDENCDIDAKVDGEHYSVEKVKEGDSVRVGNLTWGIMELDINKRFLKFNHSYRINESFCSDSDNGKDYFLFGNISGYYSTENYTYGEGRVKPYHMKDYCMEFSPDLIEFYCDDDNYISAELVSCEKCIDSACVNFTEKEIEERIRLENMGKANFDDIVICEEGCIRNDSCYSVGYNLSGDLCTESGWSIKKDFEIRSSFWKRIFGWLF